MLPPASPCTAARRNAPLAGALIGGLVAALAASAWAAPGVWKCAGNSSPVYQDRPCEPGRALRDLAADPPTVSVVPFELPPVASPPRAKPRRAEASAAKPRRTDARPAGDVAERKHVREGMREGEVLARLGHPDLASPKTGRKARWTYLPASGDPQTMTLVRFEEGRVVAVERVIVR